LVSIKQEKGTRSRLDGDAPLALRVGALLGSGSLFALLG
jgi:hypothetical protein